MGSIKIKVPGETNLECSIDDTALIEEIIRLLENADKKNNTDAVPDDVVGIWKDRFPEDVPTSQLKYLSHRETL